MKKIKNILVLQHLLLTVALMIAVWFTPATDAEAAEFCSDEFYINETLPNGN